MDKFKLGHISKKKTPPSTNLLHSDTQIMKLHLEFRRLQKELTVKNRNAYNYVKVEKEKVMEVLNDENISIQDDLRDRPRDSKQEEGMNLLLTDGKIDLDKVLCLHIFSISQPLRCKKGKLEGSNMRINPLIRYSSYLPCYLVEHIETRINCTCWGPEHPSFNSSERSMTLHLQVNNRIEKMVHTVINVLKNLNPSKLKDLSARAQSVEQIQCTLEKPENQTFLSSLLHSKFLQDSRQMRTEMCTVMQGKTHLIQDISKFKKNLVFRLDVPESLSEVYNYLSSQRRGIMKLPTGKEQAESSFDQLLQIKKHIGSNISIIPGYQLLQKGSSAGGIAVIDQTGTSISYLAGQTTHGANKPEDITIIMQLPKITDHEYVVEKMSEMSGDKIVIAHPRNKTEEISLRIAKRNMAGSKKIAQDDSNHDKIKEGILRKLSNEERIAIGQKKAKLKGSSINSKGEPKTVSIAELLKGTVERHSLLKLVRESTDAEREVLFKPVKQGGMGIGEILMNKNELKVMSQLEGIKEAKNVALIQEECNFRAPKKLNVEVDSQFGILKIEQEVSKKEIYKSCRTFERQLMKKK